MQFLVALLWLERFPVLHISDNLVTPISEQDAFIILCRCALYYIYQSMNHIPNTSVSIKLHDKSWRISAISSHALAMLVETMPEFRRFLPASSTKTGPDTSSSHCKQSFRAQSSSLLGGIGFVSSGRQALRHENANGGFGGRLVKYTLMTHARAQFAVIPDCCMHCIS